MLIHFKFMTIFLFYPPPSWKEDIYLIVISLRLLECTCISRETEDIGFHINKEILKHSPRKTRLLLRELHNVKNYDT